MRLIVHKFIYIFNRRVIRNEKLNFRFQNNRKRNGKSIFCYVILRNISVCYTNTLLNGFPHISYKIYQEFRFINVIL